MNISECSHSKLDGNYLLQQPRSSAAKAPQSPGDAFLKHSCSAHCQHAAGIDASACSTEKI